VPFPYDREDPSLMFESCCNSFLRIIGEVLEPQPSTLYSIITAARARISLIPHLP
jgi:hypothetical protein